MKKILINIAKLLLAAAIIFWLITNGKLDPKSILKLFSNPFILIPSFVLIAFQIFIGAIRWKTLLSIKSSHIKDTKRIFMIQWIGQFFSSALPGAVTGDLIKLTYIKKMDEKMTTKFLLLSVLMDRLIGLLGLLFISGTTSIVFYRDLIGLSPEMPRIIMINFFLLLAGLLGIGLFFLPLRMIDLLKHFIKVKKLIELLESFKSIRIQKTVFAKLILLSSLSHLLGIFVFYLINNDFYESSIRLRDLMTIIPIGQIAIAIPISPAGLGVGHLAYQKLFSFINQTNGAILFNNYWIISLLVNLLGFIPYLFLRRLPSDSH